MPPKLKRPGEAPSGRNRIAGGWIALGAVGIAIALGVTIFDSAPPAAEPRAAFTPAPVPPPAPPGATELLDGLAPGQALGAWKVHVLRIVDKQLGVDLLNDGKVVTVWIARKGSRPAAAPRETEKYALFFGHPPESREVAARDMEMLLSELEARVKRREGNVRIPEGM